MSALRSNLAAKIIAIFLAGIMGFLVVFSIADIFLVTYLLEKYGTKDILRQELAEQFLDTSGYAVLEQYDLNNGKVSSYDNANFYFEIYNKKNEIIHSNFNGEDFWFSKTYRQLPTDNYAILYVKENLQPIDNMSLAIEIFEFVFEWRSCSILIIILCGVSFILLITFLLCSAGHKAGTEGITPNIIDKIPLEIYTAFFVIIVVLENLFLDYLTHGIVTIGFVSIFAVIDFLLIIGYSMSIAMRIKSRTLFTNTIIWRVLHFLIKIFKKLYLGSKSIFYNIPIIWKSVLTLVIISLLELICINVYWNSKGTLLYYWFIEKLILIPCILLIILQFKKIKNVIKKISKGNIDVKTDAEHMYLDFKETVQDLNNISLGLSTAVDERMKSERFKTELITNVSHDIKTPLTSIINYVDLIKKEPIKNENIKEYVGVLDRQSKRLKKLIEDLVEASKASSGSLSVNLKPLDLSVLLIQIIGEYQERMENNLLQLIISCPDKPIIVMADSRHLWRIFDNLMNNIIKYSQSNTRVYLSLEKIEDRAVVTFRNISKEKLNISSEELMERFVRGDSSRNTEGSGLGLSIAKSLTELQKGNIQLFVDGDLFKVVLTFKLLNEEGIVNGKDEFNTNS